MNNIYGYNEQPNELEYKMYFLNSDDVVRDTPDNPQPALLPHEPISNYGLRKPTEFERRFYEETWGIKVVALGDLYNEMWYEVEPEQDWIWLAGINI